MRLLALLFLSLTLPAALSGQALPEPSPRLTAAELASREQKAGPDPVQLLLLVPLAREEAARKMRRRVHDLLTAHKGSATPAELEALADRLAALLPRTVRSPAGVREVLGPPCQVARQILYRRYLEQWTYDSPLPLYVLFDCRKGEEPRLQSVHLNRPEKM
jgi:hypothetical protein